MDQFGNYVVQHVLEYGKRQEDKNRIVYAMKGNILEYSNHKFASNVIEKCLGFGMPEDKKEIIQEILEGSDDEELQMTGPLFLMMKDRYGNYVIQKCIEVAMGTQKDFLIKRIQSCANILKKQQNYSRHVYNFLEKVSTLGMEKKPSKGK